MGRSIHAPLKRDNARCARDAELAFLGGQAGNIYYCVNFMSTFHWDGDASVDEEHEDEGMLQPCFQLEKSGCKEGEYDFVMLKWGIRIRTETNALWYVIKLKTFVFLSLTY